MPLVAAVLATFAIVYFLQKKRGAIMFDRLHRATLAAFGAGVLIVIAAIVIGG